LVYCENTLSAIKKRNDDVYNGVRLTDRTSLPQNDYVVDVSQ